MRGYIWWEDEQSSEKVKHKVEGNLKELNWKTDIILSHTCPLKYEPREVFLSGIDQNEVDKRTEAWFDYIESKLEYQKWYCGHYHINKKIDKIEFLFKDIKVMEV